MIAKILKSIQPNFDMKYFIFFFLFPIAAIGQDSLPICARTSDQWPCASLNWPANGKVIANYDQTGGKGIDIGGSDGDPILASSDGEVVYVGSGLRGYGKLVLIRHDRIYLTAYAHNRKILVSEGQSVKKGQQISEMGSSSSDRVKLRFEIRERGKSMDPLLYLDKRDIRKVETYPPKNNQTTNPSSSKPYRSGDRDNLDGQSGSRIRLVESGGTFKVPVRLNDQFNLNFTVDSGASDVTVPADVVMTLMRTGTILESDFLGHQTYILADGSNVKSRTFVLRSLQVGSQTISNVEASVADVKGSLLLGQSFLKRFKSWSIDNATQELVLN